MSNPLLQKRSNNPIKNLYRTFLNSKDPTMLLNNSKEIKQVLQLCKGQNPKEMFYRLCKEKNVNPEDILNELRY